MPSKKKWSHKRFLYKGPYTCCWGVLCWGTLVSVVVEIELQSSVILLGSHPLVEEVTVNCYMVNIQALQSCTSYLVNIQASKGNQVVIRSPPVFPLILGPTNIRLNPGFKVIGWVNCYLVNIQVSQYTLRLSGQRPGFTILYFQSGQRPVFRRKSNGYPVVSGVPFDSGSY